MKMIVPFSLSPSKIRPLYFSLVVFMFAGGLVHVRLHTLYTRMSAGQIFYKVTGENLRYSLLSVFWRHLCPKLRLECSFPVLLPPYLSLSRNTD